MRKTMKWCLPVTLREKCPNTESKSPYLVQIQKNTDQKKLRIWTLFTQCKLVQVASSNIIQDLLEKTIGLLKYISCKANVAIFWLCI